MELVLDRKIAENFIFPAVEIFKSGTRREELLLPEMTLQKIYLIPKRTLRPSVGRGDGTATLLPEEVP